MKVEVANIKIDRRELAIPELNELFGIPKLPLAPAKVEVELRGISTAEVNALRRVITDEMLGCALKVPQDGFDVALTTDKFMIPQFVNGRIESLRLKCQIPVDVINTLRLKLDVHNDTMNVRNVYAGDLKVTAGKMTEPLFNPTTTLAFLQPGMRIVINNIAIVQNTGRNNANHNVACRTAYTHLDLEQYTEDDMRLEDGVAADLSGYKISCLIANPQHHILKATIPATSSNLAEIRAVFSDGCVNIKERLRLIYTTIDRRDAVESHGIQFTVVKLEEGLNEGILQLPGETYTIGELLKRSVFDNAPDITNVSYIIRGHENRLIFTIRHTEDVTAVLIKALQRSLNTFDTIQKMINAFKH